MAKVGLYLHGARGKLAGVSFQRGADGQTVAREIVTPYNPNTDPQIFQRAIMATVIRAYSVGKEIFDHSFEKYSVGAASQARFLSLNARKLRQALAEDYNNSVDVERAKGAVVDKGTVSPIPFTYVVSEGSLEQKLFDIRSNRGYVVDSCAPAAHMIVDQWTDLNKTIAEFLAEKNVAAGDIFTFIGFATPTTSIKRYERQAANGTFGFARVTVKKSAMVSDITMQDAKWSDIFEQDMRGKLFPANIYCFNGWLTLTAIADFPCGAMGVIQSRENSKLRSNCTLTVINEQIGWGIKYPYVVDVWKRIEPHPVPMWIPGEWLTVIAPDAPLYGYDILTGSYYGTYGMPISIAYLESTRKTRVFFVVRSHDGSDTYGFAPISKYLEIDGFEPVENIVEQLEIDTHITPVVIGVTYDDPNAQAMLTPFIMYDNVDFIYKMRDSTLLSYNFLVVPDENGFPLVVVDDQGLGFKSENITIAKQTVPDGVDTIQLPVTHGSALSVFTITRGNTVYNFYANNGTPRVFSWFT